MTPLLYQLRIGVRLGLTGAIALLRELIWPSDPLPLRLEDVPVFLRGLRVGLGLAAIVAVLVMILDRALVLLLSRLPL